MRMTTVLYVHRDFVGRLLPFDKVYFFHRDDEKNIPRVFSNAFVLPINQRFADVLAEVITTSDSRQEEYERDHEIKSEYALRFKAHGFNRLDESQQKEQNKTTMRALTRILENRSKYLALVPVLFTKQRMRVKSKKEQSQNKLYPQYLGAAKRRKEDDVVKLLGQIVGARSYFVHQGEMFRPLCLLCPRSIDSVVGDCQFGSSECYTNLAQVGPSDFVRGVKAYRKLTKNIDEPMLNLKEGSDAKLPLHAN